MNRMNTDMNRPDSLRSRKSLLRIRILRNLFFYAVIPLLILWFLARPVGSAVLRSGAAAFGIMLAALGAAGLNWFVYKLIHRKRPPLPVFAHGVLCLLIVVFVQHEALPNDSPLTSALAMIAGFLSLLDMLLLSFWLASRQSRPAHVFAVGLRIVVGLVLFFMAYQIFRDIESRNVTRDTWITAGILVVIILIRNSPGLYARYQRAMFRRRATGLAAGWIVQIVGETHLDLDGDPVTPYYARVQYEVNDELYEIRADISRFTARRYGRKSFIGREVPVFYNPSDPAEAYTGRIDRHIFDG